MKYALVTGASSGIGARFAHHLAAEGHNIIIVSNQLEASEQVAAQIKQQYNVDVRWLIVDLSEKDAAQNVYNQATEIGEVDILISNAGILHFGKLLNTTTQYIDLIVNLHCITTTKLSLLFGHYMAERGCGKILIVSSMTAWTPFPTMSLYGSTKVYLKSFAQSLWYELKGCGVSVTTLFPGAVDTPLYNLSSGKRKLFRALGIMLSADRVARKGLRAMKHGCRVAIPGLFTKLVVAICYIFPAHLLLPIMKIPSIRRILDKI